MYNREMRFSLWCDFVERRFLQEAFGVWVRDGVINAATSNPAIFKSALLHSSAYDAQKSNLQGMNAKERYEALAIEDIKLAAHALLPLYEKGDDGFISIEVDPFLCDDALETIAEGKRLFARIGYPNVMIKVPATPAGFEAMEALMAEGIHVNATLIFSLEQTQKCLHAFEKGCALFVQHFPGRSVPQGVISIFVSRFDRMLDPLLKQRDFTTARVGIMNALRCYHAIQEQGMSNVRALFASTGVKGDALAPDYYIRELFVPDAINTAPLETIEAFLDAGKVPALQTVSSENIAHFMNALEANGIVMQQVCDELMREGLKSFKEAFVEILNALE